MPLLPSGLRWPVSVFKKVEANTWLLNPGEIELQHNKRIPGAKRSKQNAGETRSKSLRLPELLFGTPKQNQLDPALLLPGSELPFIPVFGEECLCYEKDNSEG